MSRDTRVRPVRLGLRRAGFTMVELLLALSLLSILIVALVELIDTTLTIMTRTEISRDLQEMGTSVLDLVAEDVYALEVGPRGDMVGDWVRFDVDRDGLPGLPLARLRFVRNATAAELMRARPVRTEEGAAPAPVDPNAHGLVEVCWVLLPPSQAAPDERQQGILWRGERWLGDDDSISFLDERFFSATGKPTPGSLDIVTGGVLWFEVWYAAQTSIVHDGWSIGDDIKDCAASWDAFGRGRPDQEMTYLNAPARGMPEADDLPLLPRRLRVTLEIERPNELRRRTRVSNLVTPEANEIFVDDEERLPDKGGMILVGEEWMRIEFKSRGQATVTRALRGTRRQTHEAGILVHHGSGITREIPVPVVREEWNL